MNMTEFNDTFIPLPRPAHHHTCELKYIETWLAEEKENNADGVDLNPDFQRGHVWSLEQQKLFVENMLRRIIDQSGLTLRFNCPSWRENRAVDSDLPDQLVCLDGLQRLSSIRDFISGKFGVCGVQFDELPLAIKRTPINIQIFDFQYRKDVLKFYLDINGGGVAHTEIELNRVRELLERL